VSARAAAAIVFAIACLTLPLPLLGLSGSLVPVARFAQLAAVMLVLVAAEGAGGMVGVFTALLVAHAVVYAGLLAVAAWLLARFALARLSPPRRSAAALGLCLAMIALAGALSLGDGYDTQFHHTSPHARIWELYW